MLNRPQTARVEPRMSHYFGDGTGRDAFILYNSGGNVKNVNSFAFKSSSSQKFTSYDKRPRIEGKPCNYHADGSGRDYFIVKGNGGFSKDGGSSHFSFRQNEPRRSVAPGDYFTMAQSYSARRPEELKLEKEKKETIRDLVQRLATPTPKKYKSIDPKVFKSFSKYL